MCATDATPSTSSNLEIESSFDSGNTSFAYDSEFDEMLNITPRPKRIKRDLNLFTVSATLHFVSATLKNVRIVTEE